MFALQPDRNSGLVCFVLESPLPLVCAPGSLFARCKVSSPSLAAAFGGADLETPLRDTALPMLMCSLNFHQISVFNSLQQHFSYAILQPQ